MNRIGKRFAIGCIIVLCLAAYFYVRGQKLSDQSLPI